MPDGAVNETVARRASRVRFPLAVVLAVLTIIGVLHFTDWVESYLVVWSSIALCLLAAGMLVVWFAASRAFSARTRRRGLAAIVIGAIALIGALRYTTRIDGTINGVGVPRLAWRWLGAGRHALTALPTIAPSDGSATAAVNLATIAPQDSPEFLGAGRGNAAEGAHLARDWSSQPPRMLWRQPIGLGWSSFAVVGSYAITQEQRGERELVVCYEVSTGHARWEHVNDRTHFSEWQGGDGPRATPTIAGGRVYAMGATGILDCLDGASGQVIWSRNILDDAGASLPSYGKSCSPLVVDDLVVVTGGNGGPSLMAYRAADGAPAWRAGRETPGYASPVVATLAGRRQILTVNEGSLTAHDLSDGHILWRFDWPGRLPKNTQPIALDDRRLLLSTGYGLGTDLLTIAPSAEGFALDRAWHSRFLKPKFSNNAVHGNYVYGLDDGTLVCLDLSSGRRMWRGEHYGFGQLLRVDDLLLVQSEPGDVALVDADPHQFKELGRFPALEGKTWTQPALAGHRLLVRNDHEAACYEIP